LYSQSNPSGKLGESIMNDLDKSVVTLVGHGHTESLAKSGFDMAYIEDSDARAIYRSAIDMLHRATPVKPNRLNLMSATFGELVDPNVVKELLSLNGSGDAVPDIVARKCQDRHLLTQAKTVLEKYGSLVVARPRDIRDWLPTLAADLESVATSGVVYNPNPEAHKGSIIAPVLFRSELKTYNKMFEGRADDGGGYRAGWWIVWLGLSGHGKTTHAYTQAVDAIKQDRRAVFISKENQKTIRGRVLIGLTGLTIKEIESEIAEEQKIMHGPDGQVATVEGLGPFHLKSVRQELLNGWVAKIQDGTRLRLYDWTFFNSARIKRIVRDELPDQLHIDYIDPNDIPGNDKISGLGKISSQLEAIAHSSQTHLSGYFQVSADEKRKYEKSDEHEIGNPFGSSMVTHTSDQQFQTKKWRMPDTQHMRRTKCRAGGLNEEWRMRFNPETWTYIDPF